MDKEGTAQAFRTHQAPDVSLVLISTVIALTVYFVINRWWRRERWEKYGVKHVNVGMYTFPEARNRFLMARPELTVGFSSDTPVLITRDLDLLKQILVKDFNNFSNRGTPIPTKSPLGQGLFFLNDSDWKRIRQLMSPSFSTGKLKRISIHVQDAANRLSEVFQKCAETGTNLKLFHTTGQYTSSIIAKTAFGVAADSIGQEEDDQFTYFVKNIFKKRSKHSPIFLAIFLAFPRFQRFLTFTLGLYFPDPITSQSTDYFQAILKETIAEREVAERQGSRHVNNDFLQSLVSTMVASEEKTTAEDKSEEKKTPISNGSMNCSTSPKKTISTQEIIAQSVLTIFAAYETTASTLQFCLYKLAQNPEVQEKVYEEILAVVEHEDPTHEELAKLNYMGQVIDETLRLFPPLVRIRRQAVEARTYGPITIPAGANVEIPIKEIHRDPSHYPDPEVFDPDRFSAENKSKRNPLAFIPFGQGPRLCIGMRLAYLELKIALVQVLRKVKVELNDTTVPRKGEEITTTYTLIFPRSKEPIELAVKFRGE